MLAQLQEPDGSRFAGAWSARVQRGAQQWIDCNAFATALVVDALASTPAAATFAPCIAAAQTFLRRCAVADQPGSFAFWSAGDPAYRAGADLDDTALIRGILRDRSAGHDDPLEALRLFGPHRITRGTPLAATSRWAARFPGLFGTWMDGGVAIVDLAVNANVVGYLRSIGAEIPGVAEAEGALCQVLDQAPHLERYAPYYPSRALILWRCAVAMRAGARIGTSLRRRLRAEVAGDCAPTDTRLLEAALVAVGIPPVAHRTVAPADILVCSDLTGRIRWSSRALAVALDAAHRCTAVARRIAC